MNNGLKVSRTNELGLCVIKMTDRSSVFLSK